MTKDLPYDPSGSVYCQYDHQPANFTFSGLGKTYMLITPDGRLVAGDGLSNDEATQGMFEVLQHMFERAMLHHTTGERITRKDLNAAYHHGVEQGRVASKVMDETILAPRWSVGVYGDGSTPPGMAMIFCDEWQTTISGPLDATLAQEIVDAYNGEVKP